MIPETIFLLEISMVGMDMMMDIGMMMTIGWHMIIG